MSEFRRRLRYHQAQWREAKGYPIGTQPIVPRPGGKRRLVGSRFPLSYAQKTGANFLTAGALDAARKRTSMIEPNQSFDHQGLWADLLSSTAMAFNLFGDLAGNLKLADRAIHRWWPDAPGTVARIYFAHSPGWLDPAYLRSLRVFDAMFELDRPGGTQAVIAIDVKYRERLKAETPRPENLQRYLIVARRSRTFNPGAVDAVKGRNPLAVMWLEHLLLLSMLQHQSRRWSWGRYVVVHPSGNSDVAEACARYANLLRDRSTFASMTIERLLDAQVLPARTTAALRQRYLVD